MSLKESVYPSKSAFVTGLALFFGLFLLYIFLGTHLEKTQSHPYKYFDVLFELDPPRVIGDMKTRFGAAIAPSRRGSNSVGISRSQ